MAPTRDALIAAFAEAGHELWLAGGLVRDAFRGVPPKDPWDADFATSALPDECERIGRGLGTTVMTIGQRFGTTGVLLDEGVGGRSRRSGGTATRPGVAGPTSPSGARSRRTWRGATSP